MAFGAHTQQEYIRHVRRFAAFLGRPPDTATAEDLRRFQIHQHERGRRSGHDQRRGLGAALPVHRDAQAAGDWRGASSSPAARPSCAMVLSVEEAARLLEAAPGIKYKAALGVAYGAGLRVSEVAHLKVDDIDSSAC